MTVTDDALCVLSSMSYNTECFLYRSITSLPNIMKTQLLLPVLLLFVSVMPLFGQEVQSQMTPDEFAKHADSMGLVFTMPEGFRSVPTKENPNLWYDFAIMSEDSAFEVRYTIWPLQEALQSYQECLKDTSCLMVHPNKFFQGRAQTNVLNMTSGAGGNTQSFPADAVKEEFNADAGGSAMFEFDCVFGEGYTYGQAVILHKDDVADLLITFMSKDIKEHQKYFLPCFYTLMFQE